MDLLHHPKLLLELRQCLRIDPPQLLERDAFPAAPIERFLKVKAEETKVSS